MTRSHAPQRVHRAHAWTAWHVSVWMMRWNLSKKNQSQKTMKNCRDEETRRILDAGFQLLDGSAKHQLKKFHHHKHDHKKVSLVINFKENLPNLPHSDVCDDDWLSH
jgi:uncharacterized membrane protein